MVMRPPAGEAEAREQPGPAQRAPGAVGSSGGTYAMPTKASREERGGVTRTTGPQTRLTVRVT